MAAGAVGSYAGFKGGSVAGTVAGGEVGKRVGEQVGRAVGKHAGGIVGALAIGSLAYSLYYKLAGDHGKEPTKRDLQLALERERVKVQMLIEQNRRTTQPQMAFGSNSANQKLMDKLDDIQGQLDQVDRIRESEFEPDFQEGIRTAAMAGGKLALGGLKKLGSSIKFAAQNPGAAIKKVGEVTKPLHSPSQVLGDRAAKSSNGIVSKVGKIFSTENQAKAGAELFDSAKMGPQLPFKRKAAAFGSKVAGAVGDMAAQQGALAAGGAAVVGAKKMVDATRSDLDKTRSRSVIKSAGFHSAVNGTALGAISGMAGGKAAALVGGTAGATLGAAKGVKRALGFQAKDAEKVAAANPQAQDAPGHSAGQPIPEGYKMVFGRVVKVGSGTQPARAPH